MVLLCTFLLLTIPSIASPGSPPNLIDEAWNAWGMDGHAGIEQRFLDAIQSTPDNPRPYLGLSYLYAFQRRYQDAWTAYENALKRLASTEATYPYLFAAWYTPKLNYNLANGNTTVLNLMERLAANADSAGILKGMANQRLGRYYLDRNQVSKADLYFSRVNAVVDWTVIGPFDNTSASGHEKLFPPEQQYDPAANYQGRNGVPARWFRISAHRRDNWIDFDRYFTQPSAIYYANTFIYSPERRTVQIRIGTSGSFKIFLNDEMIREEIEEYNNDLDTYITETDIQKGWNRVLVKCGSSGRRAANFLLRITDSRGEPIEGLRTDVQPVEYANNPGAPARPLAHFAEMAFQAQTEAYPNHPENNLLLADTYLRSDKAIEAELTLREAIRRTPNCPIFYEQIIDAYNRGDKNDEVTRALDRIYAIDRESPTALEYKFYHFIETEQIEQATAILKRYEALRPESMELYAMQLLIYSRKEQTEKLLELSRRAYERFPMNTNFLRAQAMVTSQATRQPKSAITMYENYLRQQGNDDLLIALASLYQEQLDITGWRTTYDRLLERSPASPGYYYQMAQVYQGLRDYENAREMLQQALSICPNSSALWSKLGDVERAQDRDEEAIASYRNALEFDPTNYEARAVLRDLLGKPPAFSYFEDVNVDSILNYARRIEGDPDDAAVILFDHAQHVIYEKGASESMQEMVAKMTSRRGIDAWKEYVIPYNSYHEELLIDKAAVVKSDGSEVQADVSDNYVVFKSLGEGDVIHLKWHVKNHYAGKLSNHFFDSYYFNSFYPSYHVRYELLAPKDFTFRYATQNMDSTPSTSQVDDGIIYRWTMEDLPALSYEYGMPTLDDIGSILHISSIDTWEYMVDWYADIATTKARTSYEIREQVEEILDGRDDLSDEEKMQRIYNFITENIRYSSVGFRQGAHIPQKARDVLVNKIGDCKDVAALCIAMLREAGLRSHYVLVNTRDAGLNRHALPSIAFNHCIVAVETPRGDRYLDLTANNFPIGSIPEGDMEAFALVIRPGVASPIYLPKQGTIPRNLTVRTSVQMLSDFGIKGTRSTTASGTIAASLRDVFRDQPRREQEKMLLASLNASHPNVKLSALSIDNLNNLEPEVRYEYSYAVPDYLTEAGDFSIFRLPWSTYASADDALSYEEREYPYAYWPSEDTLSEQMTVELPRGYEPVAIPSPVKLSSAIAEYSMKYSFTGGKLIAERRFINKKSVVQPEEYAQFKSFHNSVIKEDGRQLLLRRKGRK